MIGTATKARRRGSAYPERVKTPAANEQEAAYQAALKLVARIDEDLRRGVRHYRNRAGELLTTLDEVVRAVLRNELFLPEEQSLEMVQVPVGVSRHNGVYPG